jgi:hypothetical protein
VIITLIPEALLVFEKSAQAGPGILPEIGESQADPVGLYVPDRADPSDPSGHKDRHLFLVKIKLDGNRFIEGDPLLGYETDTASADIDRLGEIEYTALFTLDRDVTTDPFCLSLVFHCGLFPSKRVIISAYDIILVSGVLVSTEN